MCAALAPALPGAGPSTLAAQDAPAPHAHHQDAAATERTARVLDRTTGAPVPGVRVTAGPRMAHTDAEGRFRIEVPAGVERLELRRPGYRGAEIALDDLQDEVLLVPAPFQLGAIAVTSERRAALAEGTSLDVESVDAHHLHHRGTTSVAEGLGGVAGLSVQRPGSWGARPVLRGMGGERVAVLVDGSRVNRACVFGMDQGLATVDPASVERVEVLQGPGSALYGSGNVGGVINVVTRTGPEEADRWGEARIAASSAVPGGTAGGTVGARRGSSWFSVSSDLALYDDYRSGTGRVDGTSYRQGSAELAAGLEPAPDHRIDLQGQLYEARDIGWPMHGEAEIPRETRRNASLDWAWQRGGFLDGVSARGYVQRLDHEMRVRMMLGGDGHGHERGPGPVPAAAAGGGGSGAVGTHDASHEAGHGGGMAVSTTDARSHTTTAGLRLQARILPHHRAHVDAGVEVTRLGAEGTRWTETIHGPDGTPEHVELRSWPAVSIVDGGLFGQGEWRVGGSTAVTGGLRLERVRRAADDRPRVEEWVPSGNVGFRAPLVGPFSLRSTLGWGYRTPDATELYGLALRPDGYVYQGNPEVETERGRNAELSLVMETGSLSGTATAYQNDLSGLIVPEAVPGEEISGRPVRRYRNVDEARIRGLSTSLRWDRDAWTVDGAGSYVRGTDRVRGTPLPEIPPLEGTLAVRRDLGFRGAWIQAELQGASRQGRVATELNEPETPGYAVPGLRGGFEVAGTRVVLGAENLTDRAYRSHLDPPTLLRPGRNLHLRLSRSF